MRRLQHDDLKASLEPAYQLARGYGKSRFQIFEQNGTRDEAILRHPHFQRHLRYFILGPDLPPEIIAEFEALTDDCGQITSGDQQGFCDLARSQVRKWHLERKDAGEEYYKLCGDQSIETLFVAHRWLRRHPRNAVAAGPVAVRRLRLSPSRRAAVSPALSHAAPERCLLFSWRA